MTETAGALYFWLGEQADQIGFPAPQQVLAPCDMHAGYTYSLLIGQDGKAQVVDVRKAASATFGECGR